MSPIMRVAAEQGALAGVLVQDADLARAEAVRGRELTAIWQNRLSFGGETWRVAW